MSAPDGQVAGAGQGAPEGVTMGTMDTSSRIWISSLLLTFLGLSSLSCGDPPPLTRAPLEPIPKSPRAKMKLALQYRDGIGKARDLKMARELLLRACGEQYTPACSALGFLYLLLEQPRRGQRYLALSCRLGSPSGCVGMGTRVYLQKRPVRTEYVDSHKRFISALIEVCWLDPMKGYWQRADVHERYAGGQYHDALDYYQRGCELGEPKGCHLAQWLGRQLELYERSETIREEIVKLLRQSTLLHYPRLPGRLLVRPSKSQPVVDICQDLLVAQARTLELQHQEELFISAIQSYDFEKMGLERAAARKKEGGADGRAN